MTGEGLGMIVRSDLGGLGIQTYELWKRLRPSSTFVIDLPLSKSRGQSEPGRFKADWTTTHIHQDDQLPSGILGRWLRSCDRLITVENMYSGARGFERAKRLGVTTILVANPELYQSWAADRIAVPTVWEWGRMPKGTLVVPHPQERYPLVQRRQIRRFVHHWAPAMLDRNGTNVVMSALPLVQSDCEVHIHAPGRPSPLRSDRIGRCRVTWNSQFVDDPWDGPAGDADCFLLPRRYGGQCLPAMEAAARSMVLLMSDVAPQKHWPIRTLPSAGSTPIPMKGGQFPVYEFDPRRVAAQIDCMTAWSPQQVKEYVERTWRWIGLWSWDRVRPRWEELVCPST